MFSPSRKAHVVEMLNRQFPSSSSKKCSTAPTAMGFKKIKEDKRKKNNRSPLQDLNINKTDTGGGGISISRSFSNNSTISSSISVEAPRGCLRFFSKTPIHGHTPRRKSLSKNQIKSAPNQKRPSISSNPRPPSKENHPSQKPKKNPPCLYQWQSVKRTSSSKTAPEPKHFGNATSSASGSERYNRSLEESDQHEQQQQCYPGELLKFPGFPHAEVEDCTPIGKLAIGSLLNCKITVSKSAEESSATSTSTKTPPVQASLSPEIQCDLVSGATQTPTTTITCYGAGHVVSGVTDRRKCRPRGILTVGGAADSSGWGPKIEDDALDKVNDKNGIGVLRKSRPSLIPLPAEASMSWHLSRSREDSGEFEKGDGANGLLYPTRKSVGSARLNLPSSPCGFDSTVFGNPNHSGSSNINTTGSRKTKITLLSPRALPEFQGFLGSSSEKMARHSSSASPCVTPSCKALLSQEDRTSRYNFTGESSPFSVDSLSSGNVIQTPKSDSSSGRHVDLSWLNGDVHPIHNFDSELDSMAEVLQRGSLSPGSHMSLWDPLGLSFQLADLTSSSNSIDLNHTRKNLDIHASWISDSTLENVSQSQMRMRISWRDGLVSRIFEMDDLDCCRLLSDEENCTDEYSNDQFKSHLPHNLSSEVHNNLFSDDDYRSPKNFYHKMRVDGKEKAILSPSRLSSCAESICIDGGGLVASGDSDWTLCYKNKLFEV